MAPIWQWGPDMAPTVGPRLCSPCSGILALCGYMYMLQHSKLYYLCHLSLFLAFATTQPTPTSLPPTPLYMLAQY